MFSKEVRKRGLERREEVDLTKLQQFHDAMEGKYFIPPKKVSVKGLALSGRVIEVTKLFKGDASHPWGQRFKFQITGPFSKSNVGDDKACRVYDATTAVLYPLWNEHFSIRDKLKEEFFTQYPDASKDREYTYGVPCGAILLKPGLIIDIQVTLREIEKGVPAPLFATSAGLVKSGSWITFTNVSYQVRRHANRTHYEASSAVPYPRSSHEEYSKISEFSLATIPFPILPDVAKPTNQAQHDLKAKIDKLLDDPSKPITDFFNNAIQDVIVEQWLEPALLDQLKNLFIFRNVGPEYATFLTQLGVDVLPWQLKVESGNSSTKGQWNTFLCTIHTCKLDWDGEISQKISYKVKCSDLETIVNRRLFIHSDPGRALTPKLIEAVKDSLVLYCTIDIRQSMSGELVVEADGSQLNDRTLVAKVQDFELDLVGAILATGIPLSLDSVNILFRNNELGTADCRKAPKAGYEPEDSDPIVNFTECALYPEQDRCYFLVAVGIPAIAVARFTDKVKSHFNDDTLAASDSLIKYLLRIKGCDEQMWNKDVERITFKNKLYEAPMIYGVKQELVKDYEPKQPMSVDDRFRNFGAWTKEITEFYKDVDAISEDSESKRQKQEE